MNAHVLRKRSLAKNQIFLLLPVLVLLMFWCRCVVSAATSSSLYSHNMFEDSNHGTNFVASFAQRPHIQITSDAHFQNVPKHLFSQKFTYNNQNSNEKQTQLNEANQVTTHNGENANLVESKLFNYNNDHRRHQHHHPHYHQQQQQQQTNSDKMIDRTVSEQSASDFVTYGLLRKRNVNASQNRMSLQQRIKRAKNDLLRKSQLRQRLRVLPKTTNINSIRNNSFNYDSSLFYDRNNIDHNNSSKNEKIIAIEKQQNPYTQRNEDASKTTASSFSYSHSNRIFSEKDENEAQFQHQHQHQLQLQHHNQPQQKIERNRRESRSDLKPANGAIVRSNQFSNGRLNGLPFSNANSPRPRRFCSARDPTTLAFEAPTVFEGKVRSMSSDRRRNFSVTFQVMEIYKRQIGLKLPPLIRLKFTYRNSSECDIYRETFRSVGHVRDELEPGKLYILFVNQIDLGNFTILGQPVKRTRKTVNDVRTGVAEKYGQRAYIESLMVNNATIREGKRLRIVCKARGQPPPKVTWFKDDRSIAKNRSRYQFVHLRRRSELIIKEAFLNDSGQYECRAKNKLARQPIRKFTRIDVLPKAQENTRNSNRPITQWTNSGSTCPVIGNAFCLNGGTCVFFKDVGEPACKCPDGFLGNRCETKNPTNSHSSTYGNNQDVQHPHQCGENNFYGSYYC